MLPRLMFNPHHISSHPPENPTHHRVQSIFYRGGGDLPKNKTLYRVRISPTQTCNSAKKENRKSVAVAHISYFSNWRIFPIQLSRKNCLDENFVGIAFV